MYLEVFHELIRQIALDCPERGVLLASVRDEILYSLDCYKHVYNNSIKFSVRR